jgi:hypothetical protein
MAVLPSNYITASCTISNNIVYKNEQAVFTNENENVAGFLLSAYQHFQVKYPKFYKMDNLSKLGWLAAEVLVTGSLQTTQYKPEDIGIVLANKNASLDNDIKYFETTKSMASPALFVYTLPNIVIGEIAIRHNYKGENAFFIFDEFDAVFIEQYVSNLINNNNLQCCICGWVDILDENYKTVLLLVEKNKTPDSKLFIQENINKIYQLQNG